MKLAILGQIIFLISDLHIFAEDFSSFYFSIVTFSTKTYVNMIVTDPFGRQTGQLNSGAIVRNIPNSSYGTESIDDILTGEKGDETVIFYAKNISKGNYMLNLFGTNDSLYSLNMMIDDILGNSKRPIEGYLKGYLTINSSCSYSLVFDPTPGSPPPTITKIVTFQTLRDDFNVAQKLNQIGDDKFVNSLIRMVNIAEKLYNKCEYIKGKDENEKHKEHCYRPVIAILELIKKRLEIVNRICDNPNECKMKCKNKNECDEDFEFNNFRKENIKDNELKDFFEEWDKDEWHQHKKICKKFVTDEALKIISEDIDWLIKSIDVEKDKPVK